MIQNNNIYNYIINMKKTKDKHIEYIQELKKNIRTEQIKFKKKFQNNIKNNNIKYKQLF